MNKFHARTTWVGNIKFPSRKEANRFKELQILERAGKIHGLKRQVRYLLIPTQYDETGEYGEKGACLERSANYVADFVYFKDGKLVVEDTKGKRTPEYIIKRKLMLSVYGIRILET